jgi:hypothetical protein
MQGVAKQGKSKLTLQAEQSGYWGRGRVSISSNRSHLSCVLGVWLPGLITAMAMVDWLELGVEGIARLTVAIGGWMEVVGEYDGMGLVTAVDEIVTGDIPKLDTAMDVVVVVVVWVEEVVLEVDGEESASALLRA